MDKLNQMQTQIIISAEFKTHKAKLSSTIYICSKQPSGSSSYLQLNFNYSPHSH